MKYLRDALHRLQRSANLQSATLLAVAITIAACLSIGVLARSARHHVLIGSVLSVGSTKRAPAYINRWCLPEDHDDPKSSSGNVAIVAFGEGRSRHLYAYPQPSASGLSANDKVWSDIDTCVIRRIDERLTLGGPDASEPR